MSSRILVLLEAENDLKEAYDWYEEKSKGLGGEFLRNIEACLFLITRNPEIHPLIYKTFRRALVRHFPFAVFYEVASDALVIYSIFHCSQNPVKWKKRLKIEH